ncbi:MAG TPA: YfjI family protein, partial [Gammaproteobacteria bacterium]|nr:YfjI family protein [Gammaproteobacteria bacterium]
MSAEDIQNITINAKTEVLSPMPLQRALSAPGVFPVDALGAILKPLVLKIAEVIQAPLGICGQSVLAAVALAVQGYADIEIDGRIIPISEFFLTIGATGERKSAVDNAVLFAHRLYQDNLRAKYDIDYTHWLKLSEAYEAAKKSALNKAKTYEEKKRVLESLGFAPLRPLDPILLTEEPTYEGLIKLLITGQPSVGLFSDEGGRFIGGHGMNNENLLKTASGMCGLWDGKVVTRVRAGESPIILAGRRVSFHLMAQPSVAQLLLSNSLLLEQGLISRCLITWPISTAGSRYYKEINLSQTEEFKAYISRLNEIFKTPLALVEGKQNELSPRRLKISDEAKKLYIKYHDQIEENVGDSGTLNIVRGFANKAPEHALRLAGIIALFQNIQCVEIETEAMTAGIELATHYLNEALRLHNSSTLDPDITLAEKLLNWLHDQKKEQVSLVEIYQLGPSQIRDSKIARRIMEILVSHHWAFPIVEGLE